jgi:hypothetical protein
MIAVWLRANWKLRCVLLGMGQADRDLASDLVCHDGGDAFAFVALWINQLQARRYPRLFLLPPMHDGLQRYPGASGGTAA